MNKYIIIRTSCGSIKNAKDLANKLISDEYCACAQISKIESIYSWGDKIQNEDEFLVEIKSKSHLLDKIREIILLNHDYETPEIISFEFNAQGKYESWLDKNTIS